MSSAYYEAIDRMEKKTRAAVDEAVKALAKETRAAAKKQL